MHYADTTACKVLDKVEEKLPIVTYTPDEVSFANDFSPGFVLTWRFRSQIMTSSKRLYDDNVKPRIDQLAQMKDSTVQKYNEVKEYGSNKLSDAKTLGSSTIQTVLNAPVNTVGWGLTTADSLVEKLLPETRQGVTSK